MTDPLNHTTTFGYDGGDLASVTDPLGRSSSRYTDAAGRVVASTDALGNLSRTQYDRRDLVTRTIDALDNATVLSYDANRNLKTVTDARGGVWSYSYDAKDRKTGTTDPLGRLESYAWDGMDNLTQLTERNAKITTYSYDALNRRTKAEHGRTVKGQGLSTPDATVSTTYDAANRATQIADSQGGTLSRSYDGLDRLLQESSAQGTVSYTYDAAGRRQSMTVAGQPIVSYAHDDANRLTGITQGTDQVGFSYDAANRRATHSLPNGIVASYGWDDANQLSAISYAQGASAVGDLSYQYDAAGRRIGIGGSLARTSLPQALTSASYNAANQLSNWAGAAHTYDANGNLTNDGAKTYSWDSRNRLASLAGAATASFSYDGVNRRSGKTIAGATTGFVYDGLNPVQELAGATVKANLLTGLGIDEFYARSDASGARSLLTDALGSTLALTDSTGAVQTEYRYEPYGATTASGEASGSAFQYTGRENDGTGLYYYRARYYEPGKGRFIASDPIGLAGGINTYAYVGGMPTAFIDPEGKWFWPALLGSSAYGGYQLWRTPDRQRSCEEGCRNGAENLRACGDEERQDIVDASTPQRLLDCARSCAFGSMMREMFPYPGGSRPAPR